MEIACTGAKLCAHMASCFQATQSFAPHGICAKNRPTNQMRQLKELKEYIYIYIYVKRRLQKLLKCIWASLVAGGRKVSHLLVYLQVLVFCHVTHPHSILKAKQQQTRDS